MRARSSFGFEATDTVSCETMGDGAASTAGDALEYFFTWQGGPRRLPLGELLVEALPSPAAALERGIELAGPRPRVAVVPQGPYVLATVRGEKRPLGDA